MVNVTGVVAVTEVQPVKGSRVEWAAEQITVPTSKPVFKLCIYFRMKSIRKSMKSGIHFDGNLFSYMLSSG
jgi:hypothetical protein